MESKIIYIGRRYVKLIGKSSKMLVYAYLDTLGDEIIFKSKVKGFESIGVTLSCIKDENSVQGPYSVLSGDDAIKCGPGDIAKWHAEDKQAMAEKDVEAKAKSAAVFDKFEASLEDLRDAYKRCNPSTRPMFIANLVYKITK